MSMTDPVADLLTRIRNGQTAGHKTVLAPASTLKEAILKVLISEGYIVGYERQAKDPQDELSIALKYNHDGDGAILGIKRESTPGRRVYVGAGTIPNVRHGLGVAIVSTSKGVMADHSARQTGIGGELLCSVW